MKDVKVGVIRWDAWIGELGYQGLEVERSLGPEHYHHRLPYFGQILEKNRVTARGSSQEIIDNDIRLAKAAGVDYFAFLWYGGRCDGEMEICKRRYLESLEAGAVNWCYILGGGWCSVVQEQGEDSPLLYETAELAARSDYQKTADGRPVFYLFEAEERMLPEVGRLREVLKNCYGVEMYLIGMTFFPDRAAAVSQALGLNALSRYSTGDKFGVPYRKLMSLENEKWREVEYAGRDIVPSVSAGWDKRPRAENPVLWEASIADTLWDWHVQEAKPEELAEHLETGMRYAAQHGNPAFSSVIVYAWNEHDEGGYICPTIVDRERGGRPAYLEAISKKLAEIRCPEGGESAFSRLKSAGVFSEEERPGGAVGTLGNFRRIVSSALGIRQEGLRDGVLTRETAVAWLSETFRRLRIGTALCDARLSEAKGWKFDRLTLEELSEFLLELLFSYNLE